MSQAAENLREALHELEQAVQAQASVDPQVRLRLEAAITEIRAALANLPADADSSPADSSLTGQLAGVARDFEASHPTLSGMVGSVIDALARMGI